MPLKKLVQFVVAVLVIAAVGVGGAVWWRNKQTFETTDNAYVEAETVSVAPQIDGYVADILVQDNERVIPGQVLVRLDPADAQNHLSQAQASVAAAQAAVHNVDDRGGMEQEMIDQRQAAIVHAQAAAEQARLDLDRYRSLAGRGFATQQQLQQATAAAPPMLTPATAMMA